MPHTLFTQEHLISWPSKSVLHCAFRNVWDIAYGLVKTKRGRLLFPSSTSCLLLSVVNGKVYAIKLNFLQLFSNHAKLLYSFLKEYLAEFLLAKKCKSLFWINCKIFIFEWVSNLFFALLIQTSTADSEIPIASAISWLVFPFTQ